MKDSDESDDNKRSEQEKGALHSRVHYVDTIFYADDIVLIMKSEDDLQLILSQFYKKMHKF